MATTYDKASLVMIPSGYKDDKLYSVKPTDGSGDFTFSRDGSGASPATRVNASGYIEKGRENLLLQSNQFDTTWTLDAGMTLTSGQTGYDGSSDAWLLQRNAAFDYLRQDNTNSGVQTFSVYAKAGSLDFVLLRFLDGGGYNGQYFDLSNGTLGTTDGSLIDSNITSIGSGWYRCDVTINTTLQRVWIYPVPSDNGVGDATAGNIYIQDAQLEQGLVATDYIETTTTAVSAGLLGDMPRLDYSGGATCPSLLLEPSRTNAFHHSEYFNVGSGGGWTPLGSPTIELGYESPEGLNNAVKVTRGSNKTPLRSMDVATLGSNNSFSIWAKAGTATKIILDIGDVGDTEFTLTSEWQRFDIVVNPSTYRFCDISMSASSSIGDYFYIYGAQLEAGASYPTSYIPTYGSAASRAADSSYVTGVSDLIGQTEGTIFAEFEIPQDFASSEDHRFTISDGGAGNWIFVSINNIDNIRIFHRTNNISNIDTSETGVISHGTTYKVAFAYKSGSSSCYLNGTEIISSSATLPAPTANLSQINLTGDSSTTTSSPQIFGLNVKQRIQFKTRLTNAELAALTTL